MPTNAPSMSLSSKFTAPRPRTGGAASCQHSRRAALLAADIAVILRPVDWLTAPEDQATARIVVRKQDLIAASRKERIL